MFNLSQNNSPIKSFNKDNMLSIRKEVVQSQTMSKSPNRSVITDLDKLKIKIKKLEKLVKKNEKKMTEKEKAISGHSNCCSKNINVVFRMPSQDDYLKNRNNQRRKKFINPLFNHTKNKKKRKLTDNSKKHDWDIENCLPPKKKKLSLSNNKKSSNGNAEMSSQDFVNDLFETSESHSPSISPVLDMNEDSCNSEGNTLQSTAPVPVSKMF